MSESLLGSVYWILNRSFVGKTSYLPLGLLSSSYMGSERAVKRVCVAITGGGMSCRRVIRTTNILLPLCLNRGAQRRHEWFSRMYCDFGTRCIRVLSVGWIRPSALNPSTSALSYARSSPNFCWLSPCDSIGSWMRVGFSLPDN